jgi:hypothetical protein
VTRCTAQHPAGCRPERAPHLPCGELRDCDPRDSRITATPSAPRRLDANTAALASATGTPTTNPQAPRRRPAHAFHVQTPAVTPVGMGDLAGTRPPRHSSGVGVVRWCQGSTARLGRVGGVAVRWWIHRRAFLHGGAIMLRRWALLGLLVVMLLVRVGVEWSTHDVPFLGPVSVGSYPHRPRQHPKFAGGSGSVVGPGRPGGRIWCAPSSVNTAFGSVATPSARG